MTLSTGTKLGPYEIVSPIGKGGMGEVFLARDSKLDRQVAIKVLPAFYSRDPERAARFEREAKLLASLNHPNIAAIHGFDDSDGMRFLVMEYVEGETLGSHLKTGALPVEDALDKAKQIAEALEAAHAQGVIHRDLKPANVMIRADGTVKVLDFGLAKALTEESSGPDQANSPTITANYTKPGVVMGTAAYMSPEQARGRALDKRTDIWSFGIILFECLTGDSLFQGETANDSMGAIMHRDPEWSLLPPDTPPTIQLLLRRCLTKDRKRRLHDIADARIELENAIVDPTASSLGLAGAALAAAAKPGRRRAWLRKVPWALAGVFAIGFVFAASGMWRATRSRPRLPLHLNVEVSPNEPIQAIEGAQAVLSPDGTRLVFGAGSGTGIKLYVRRLDQSEAAPLSGTDGARHPFFSPDGAWIGFFAESKLKKVSVSGGAPIALCDVRTDSRGGSWSSDGTIIFVPNTTTGLWRVQEAGGTPLELTALDKEKNERSHRWPQILPGGREILFTSQTKATDFNDANIEVLSLDTGERTVLHHGGSYGRYLPSGHIVFVRNGTLFAAPFDIRRLKVTATPAPILEGVTSDSRNGGAQFAFSETGTLVYYQGSQVGDDTSLVWVDREGKTSPLLETIGNYSNPRLSPDGKRLVLSLWSSSNEDDIWVYDIERGALARLTFSSSGDWVPVWSPDGMRIAFASEGNAGNPNLYWKLADGSGEAERLTTSENVQIPCDWSPDGKSLVYIELRDETGWDIWVLGLEGDRQAELFLRTEFAEGNAVFSPDGHWLAYGSDESGHAEVYVRPFPKTGGKWQVSTDGGSFPVWSPHGKELFYRNGDAVMVVSVSTEGSSFRAEKPDLLFELETGGVPDSKPYDIAPDGQRFVWLKREEAVQKKDQAHLRFVFNWFDEVKAKVPTGKQ